MSGEASGVPSEITPEDRQQTNGAGLIVESLRVRIGGISALNDVCMNVSPGSVHGLIGPNGVGKTTLLNCASGFRAPDSGTLEHDGRPSRAGRRRPQPSVDFRRTFQQPVLINHQTALENVLTGVDTERRVLDPGLCAAVAIGPARSRRVPGSGARFAESKWG